jgi:hypothetical protein
MAAINISVAQAEIIGNVAAVVSVGLVVLLVYTTLTAFRALRDVLDDGDAGAGGGGRLAAAHARAAEMQAIGAGQSSVFAENARVDAYDAGYGGREFDPAWGEEHRESYHQAQVDRNADLAKGWK